MTLHSPPLSSRVVAALAVCGGVAVAMLRVLAMPDVIERLNAAGVEIQTSTPSAWGEFVRDEVAKWGKVVKTAGITEE